MGDTEAEAVDAEILPDSGAEVVVWPSEAILERRRSDREKLDAWKRAGQEPATVTGLDGRTYPAQQKPRPDVPAPKRRLAVLREVLLEMLGERIAHARKRGMNVILTPDEAEKLYRALGGGDR
jgi:hypothetical protein